VVDVCKTVAMVNKKDHQYNPPASLLSLYLFAYLSVKRFDALSLCDVDKELEPVRGLC